MRDLSGGTPTLIPCAPYGTPAISGNLVVWADNRAGNTDIFLYNLNTNTETRITDHSAAQQFPDISGNRIVWEDYRNGNWDIYMYDIGTATETQITTDPADQHEPAISGNRIVWQDSRTGNSDIFLYNLQTGCEQQVTSEGYDFMVDIDGDRIVWVSIRNGQRDIFLGEILVSSCFGTIIVPVNPTLTNTAINASADFTAEYDNDDHSAIWNWGDNTTSTGTVDQSANTVTGSHSYTAAGVYTVTLTVTDEAGNSSEGTATGFVVIYDPNAGFVTGGGWIMSPEGAYVADPSLIGKANFGFVSKYQKGKTVPDGNTTFHFNAANFKFKSTSYEWLVIAGPNAKYKGEGTINNSGNYGFMLTARDGQVNGGGGVDKFRIKIWDKNNGDAIVYDNQMNDPDDAEATDAIEGGSITIHSSGASKEAADASELTPVSFMLEQNYPNPFSSGTRSRFAGNPSTAISFALPEPGRVTLKVYSETGQLVDMLVDGEMNVGRHAIRWDGRNQSGHAVAAGVYLYQLVVKRQSGETAFMQTRRMAFVK